MTKPFWKTKKLEEMSQSEWESLCDGCGLCCLTRLEDEDSGAMALTNIACSYLDFETCGCTDYKNRKTNVPDCMSVTLKILPDLHWMPETCGYRLIHQGKDLYDWHPLVSGDIKTVHEAGISMSGNMISDKKVDEIDLEDHIVRWL